MLSKIVVKRAKVLKDSTPFQNKYFNKVYLQMQMFRTPNENNEFERD